VDPAVQLARVPRRPPASDLAVAGGLSLWAILEAFFVTGPGSVPMRILAGLALTLPLVFRRRFPFPVVIFVVSALVVRGVIGAENEEAASFFPAVLLATFSVSLYARRLELAAAGGVFALAGIITTIALGFGREDGSTTDPGNITIISFFVAAAWTAGFLLRRRVEHVRRVEAESGELARAAVSHERSRIARELHDIVAHSVSVISVQAGAAEQYVERDPARAREHLETVRRSAHDALTNARKHAGPVAAAVRVRYALDAVEIEVENEAGPGGPGGGSGHGLVGMRERVRVYGGTLETGPDGNGRYRVSARLPLGGER
jgi:signal transduction histidine kinase